MVRNLSGVQAEVVEIWVEICQLCSYAKEPAGFDKPGGIAEKLRHKVIPAINPGVAVADNKIQIKLDQDNFAGFQIGLRGTCKNCVGVTADSDFRISIDRSLPSFTQQ